MPRAFEILSPLLDTAEPPLLGPRRRPGAWTHEEAHARLDDLFRLARLGNPTEQRIRSLALLWHDDLDASHAISQNLADPDGSYLHGLMHRRELDFGNAAYWFRRVGEHVIYPALSREVAALAVGSEFKSKLIAGNRWNPLAMIDACEAVEVEAADASDADFLRQVQAIEFRLLLERFIHGSDAP